MSYSDLVMTVLGDNRPNSKGQLLPLGADLRLAEAESSAVNRLGSKTGN